jgi:hypothetical protein
MTDTCGCAQQIASTKATGLAFSRLSNAGTLVQEDVLYLWVFRNSMADLTILFQ